MKRIAVLSTVTLLVAGAAFAQVPGVDTAATNAVRLFQVPGGGVDHLHFTVWDTIEVPGVGSDTVELRGTYQVRRQEPSTRDWATVRMDIELLAMNVSGSSPVLGRVSVNLNGTHFGHVTGTGASNRAADCTVEGKVLIALHDLGVTVFNKQEVPLAHTITHIPPIGQGGSSPDVRIALYDVNNPDGEPVAFLRKVRTQIGGYIN